MKIRFTRSGQTVLNGKHVTGHDVCTVSKAVGEALISGGDWEAVEEPKESPKQNEDEEK